MQSPHKPPTQFDTEQLVCMNYIQNLKLKIGAFFFISRVRKDTESQYL